MKLQEQTFVINKDGELFTIYDDSLAELVDNGGEVITKRASHVEPTPDEWGWIADLAPVGGPIFGPFNTRQEALDAELEWLNQNLPKLEMPE